MTRAHIRFETSADATKFIEELNGCKSCASEAFILEDNTGKYRAEARSLLGVLYLSTEHNDHIYLVNETNDGHFPSFVDKYRVL